MLKTKQQNEKEVSEMKDTAIKVSTAVLIKGSQDGRIILLHVNWNTNYEIAIFVHFSIRCSSVAMYFYVDNFNKLNATPS